MSEKKTRFRPKGREETREEKENRWFLRDAEHYLSQLRHALLREDWEESRKALSEVSDLIDSKEGS